MQPPTTPASPGDLTPGPGLMLPRHDRLPLALTIDWAQAFDAVTCDEYDPDAKAAVIEIALRAFIRDGGECSVQGYIEDAICDGRWR